jgi:hypothetical protein
MNQDLRFPLRQRSGNPKHHLWNNNGTWWCHLTVHLPDFRKERLRISLQTHNMDKARELRDSLFALFGIRGNTSKAS